MCNAMKWRQFGLKYWLTGEIPFWSESCIVPPNTSKQLHKNFEQKLANILNNISHLNKEIILLGDVNCNYLDNKNNVSIKDLFKLRGYKQIAKTATMIDSPTLIDVILNNRPDNVINANSIISSLSDHNVIKRVGKLKNSQIQSKND